MGSIGSMLGTAGGAGGTGFAGPQSAQIDKSATTQQATDQYGNIQQGLSQQQAFLQAVQAQNGLNNQSSVFNQLQGVANGTGPNPAAAQLAQATAANTANQTAMMAGQRGASSNPALIARQAAMQGAQNQQQAIGQGATLQANQSLNALGQMGGMASTQANQQANATNAYSSGAQNAYGQVTGNINSQNNASVANQSSINSANATLASTAMQGQQQMMGNITGAAGMAMMMAAGGDIPEGADAQTETAKIEPPPAKGPKSSFGQMLNGLMAVAPMMAEGGKVAALVSPGEQYLPPKDVDKVVNKGANPLKTGEKIPGKPKVAGAKNSYANDTVPKDLEPGGIMIPRSVTQGKNPRHEAMKFVFAHFKQQGLAAKKKAK